jgi:hypothetical protein
MTSPIAVGSIIADLGAAKAELSHVAASDRVRVIKACRAAGMEL